MWLVGSTPGAAGARPRTADAEDPSNRRPVVRLRRKRVGQGRGRGRGRDQRRRRRQALRGRRRSEFWGRPLPTGGEEEVKRRSQPDHARLAAIVLALTRHAAVFWRACEKAKREPPRPERSPSLQTGARGGRARRRAPRARRSWPRMAALPSTSGARRGRSRRRDAHADVLSKTTEDVAVCRSPAPSRPVRRAGVYARETQARASACAGPTVGIGTMRAEARDVARWFHTWLDRRRPRRLRRGPRRAQAQLRLARLRRADVGARARRGRDGGEGEGVRT